MRKLVILGVAVALVAFAGLPAAANCGSLRQISSINVVAGNYSYVFTTGFEGGTGTNGSTVSDALDGSFWHVGNGDPTVGLGNDNGSFTALGGWVVPYANYPAYIKSDWTQPEIDGCIDNALPDAPAERCMQIVLSDIAADGTSEFLVATSSADGGLNYFFDQPGGAPLNTWPVPPLEITNSVRISDSEVAVSTVTSDVTELVGGLYLDTEGDCAAVQGGGQNYLPIAGMMLYYMAVPQGDPPPSDCSVGAWTDTGAGLVPLDTEETVTVVCDSGVTEDVYLAQQLVYEGGFLGPLSCGPRGDGPRIECGPDFADPASELRVRPNSGQRVRQPKRHR